MYNELSILQIVHIYSIGKLMTSYVHTDLWNIWNEQANENNAMLPEFNIGMK